MLKTHAHSQVSVQKNYHGLIKWLHDTSRWMCAVCCITYSTVTHQSKKCSCGLSSSTPEIFGLQDAPDDISLVIPPSNVDATSMDIIDESVLCVSKLKDMLMSYVPVVEFIFKKIKPCYNRLFQKCCNEVTRAPHDLKAWTRFLLFPKIILYLPADLKEKNSMTLIIHDRLSRWENGEWTTLMEECLAATLTHKKSPSEVSVHTRTLRNRIRC